MSQQEQETAGREPGEVTESRGGIRPDWQAARPGGELPELPEPELHDPPEDSDGQADC